MSDETMIDDGQGASESTETTNTTETNWKESIPEDLRSEASLSDIKDVAGLAKGYIHAQKMIGSDKVVVPSDDATKEEFDTFYNKLGRPEQSNGYEMPTENMPEGVQIDNDLVGSFFEEAHRIGLNKQQAAAIVRWQTGLVQEQTEQHDTDMEQQLLSAETTMRKEFGNAYEQNMGMAQDAARKFGGDELITMLNETGLGNSPEIIKAFANVAKAISNDEVIGGGGRQNFMTSPAEANMIIADKKRDPNFMAAYQNRDHIGHKDAVTEMGKLYESAFPVEE